MNPVFCYVYYKKLFMSAATFKSAIRHSRAVTAIYSNNTTATVYDMIAASFSCRLIAFFLFVFFVHAFTSQILDIFFLSVSHCDAKDYHSIINHRGH
jgi:hypothetical protein